MRILFSAMLFLYLSFQVYGQEKYFTRKGHVSFLSETPSERIEAHNYQAYSFLDGKAGELSFTILIRSFEFPKVLMQEHFNDNYMESDQFPKAAFKGKIRDFEKLDLKKEGSYPVEVTGEMTIHGVTRQTSARGMVEIKNGQIAALATFPVKLQDYAIAIPRISREKIAETVQVKVYMIYQPYPVTKDQK